MNPTNSTRRARRWLRVATAAFLVVCLIADFAPHHGPPHFRYTGSDPAREVWNLGWPLAMFIHDPRAGFQVGPIAYVVLPAQLFVLAAACIALLALRTRTGVSRDG